MIMIHWKGHPVVSQTPSLHRTLSHQKHARLFSSIPTTIVRHTSGKAKGKEKTSARVLTSEESLLAMQEKEKQKKKEEDAKQKRKLKREEKREAKKRETELKATERKRKQEKK